MLRFALIACLALLSVPVFAETPYTVTGPARVVDGDTFVIDGIRVRLHGIDAVEQDQTCGAAHKWACGAWVTAEVRARYEGRDIACFRIDTDRYGRMVAVCYDGETELNRALVRSGLAFAYEKYSTAYKGAERQARLAGAGLYGTGVMRPSEYRRQKREKALAAAPNAPVPASGCAIKGNISGKGTRIYHMPGSRSYADTRINTDKGERWFCTEAEAQAAGWRAVRG